MITIISSAVPGMLQILPQVNILFQFYTIQAATPWSYWTDQNKYKLGANNLIDEGHKLKMMSKMQKCKTPRGFSDVIFGGNLGGLSLSSWPIAKDSCESDSALFSDGMMSSVTIFPHGSAFSI